MIRFFKILINTLGCFRCFHRLSRNGTGFTESHGTNGEGVSEVADKSKSHSVGDCLLARARPPGLGRPQILPRGGQARGERSVSCRRAPPLRRTRCATAVHFAVAALRHRDRRLLGPAPRRPSRLPGRQACGGRRGASSSSEEPSPSRSTVSAVRRYCGQLVQSQHQVQPVAQFEVPRERQRAVSKW